MAIKPGQQSSTLAEVLTLSEENKYIWTHRKDGATVCSHTFIIF
jgi:hypothetical protein